MTPDTSNLEKPRISLLTGGGDRPYALGLTLSLVAEGISLDFIGSDFLEAPELDECSLVRVLNLRGSMDADVPVSQKILRMAKYYWKLIRYAASAQPKIFHILWNNKFELFDRTALMGYYRLLGKKIVLTAHNVNVGKRDGNDSFLNRLSLSIQYRLAAHIFVHTEKMKAELASDFGVESDRISVIPIGINNTLIPDTDLTVVDAKQKLGLNPNHKTILFFGYIAPYKGLEYMIAALGMLAENHRDYRLIIAGNLKCSKAYWDGIQEEIKRLALDDMIIERIEFIPDESIEWYFKAADVLALSYTEIFQSGVLSLAYSFGLPVVATDIASISEDVLDGETGFICRPRDSADLAEKFKCYFDSELYRDLDQTRVEIRAYANERYSWKKVGQATGSVYRGLA